MTSAQAIQESMPQFTGSERFVKWTFGQHVLSEGAQYIAESAQAYWLFDAIISHVISFRGKHTHIQAKLFTKGDQATLILDDMDGNAIATQKIPYTDFPLKEVTIWAVQSGPKAYTLMLPTEY